MFVQEIEDREFEATRYTSLADEHSAWHTVNGWRNGCPLDCAAADMNMEPEYDLAEEIAWDLAQRGIACGHCKDRHPSIDWVRVCSTLPARRA